MYLYEDSYYINNLVDCSDNHHVIIRICNNDENFLLRDNDDGEAMAVESKFTLICAEMTEPFERVNPSQHQNQRKYGQIFMLQPPCQLEKSTFNKRSLHFSFARPVSK